MFFQSLLKLKWSDSQRKRGCSESDRNWQAWRWCKETAVDGSPIAHLLIVAALHFKSLGRVADCADLYSQGFPRHVTRTVTSVAPSALASFLRHGHSSMSGWQQYRLKAA